MSENELTLPPAVYGVWIPGEGWLKDSLTRRVFSDLRRDYAAQAARMVGHGARVALYDNSMGDLEGRFLAWEECRFWARISTTLRRLACRIGIK